MEFSVEDIQYVFRGSDLWHFVNQKAQDTEGYWGHKENRRIGDNIVHTPITSFSLSVQEAIFYAGHRIKEEKSSFVVNELKEMGNVNRPIFLIASVKGYRKQIT